MAKVSRSEYESYDMKIFQIGQDLITVHQEYQIILAKSHTKLFEQ
ncbi:MAG: hypothetical protein ACMUEM_02255 [Flavobacteriales bacterium AspAUS03]